MEKFDFQSSWFSMETPPQSGTRCMVTDSEVIFIATYILEPEGNSLWIFSGMTETEVRGFKVQNWMELPKPPVKKIVEENKANNSEKI